MMPTLENVFDSELNLACCGRGSGHDTGSGRRRPRPVENVGVGGRRGWRKVGVIENVKNLGPELYVEALRDAFDVVVLKHGKVQLGDSRTDYGVPARISAKVEACQPREPFGGGVWFPTNNHNAIRMNRIESLCEAFLLWSAAAGPNGPSRRRSDAHAP